MSTDPRRAAALLTLAAMLGPTEPAPGQPVSAKRREVDAAVFDGDDLFLGITLSVQFTVVPA